MLKVTVELISANGPQHNRVLGVAHIWNNGIKSRETKGVRGDYGVKLSRKGSDIKKVWREGSVENFPRLSRNAWHLLHRALESCLKKSPQNGE